MDLAKVFGLIALIAVGMALVLVVWAVANAALALLAMIAVAALVIVGSWYVVRGLNAPSRPPE